MLGQTLERVQPSVSPSPTSWARRAGQPRADQVRDLGRPGIGHIRLRDGKAWTLLTTLNDLKGHEEPKRDRRPMGTEHGAVRIGRPGSSSAGMKRKSSAASPSRTWSSLAAGRVASLSGAVAPARRADDHRRSQSPARRRVAQALQVADLATIRSGTTIFRTSTFRQTGRSSHEGQDRRLARDVHASHGAELLGLEPSAREPRTTRRPRMEGCCRARRSRDDATTEAPCASHRHGGQTEHARHPGHGCLQGDQHHSSQHPGPDAYRGKKAVVIGSNNSAHDICAALWRSAPTSPWFSGPRRTFQGPTL